MRHHRAYMDNPKLFRTVAHRPPIARGHRTWLEVKPREKQEEAA